MNYFTFELLSRKIRLIHYLIWVLKWICYHRKLLRSSIWLQHLILKLYSLGWVCNDTQLQVTKQCKLRFTITVNFVDEVEANVVPLDICGLVLGSPYLYDRRALFYRGKISIIYLKIKLNTLYMHIK